jgi:hypothetical protein
MGMNLGKKMGGSATRKTGDVQGIFCNMREDKERGEEGGHAMRKVERIMPVGGQCYCR